jgi:hypothetical protein
MVAILPYLWVDATSGAAGAALASWRTECDGYADEYRRQRAWLGSISDAVRAHAATEMQIQRRKWVEAGCKPVGATSDEPPGR